MPGKAPAGGRGPGPLEAKGGDALRKVTFESAISTLRLFSMTLIQATGKKMGNILRETSEQCCFPHPSA